MHALFITCRSKESYLTLSPFVGVKVWAEFSELGECKSLFVASFEFFDLFFCLTQSALLKLSYERAKLLYEIPT